MLLMSLRRGGSDCLTPFNMPHKKKQARAPVLDNGCHGYRSPLRHEISRESTESVCLRKCVRPRVCVCVCGIKELLCHRYCLGPSLAFSRGAGAREGDGAFI